MFATTNDRWAWPKYIAGTMAAAFATGVATKLGEWIVESLRDRSKKKGKP